MFPLSEFSYTWVGKPPDVIPPYWNMMLVFDPYTWLFCGLSTLVAGFFLWILVSSAMKLMGPTYEEPDHFLPDFSLVLLSPYGMLNAEKFPDWFERFKRFELSSTFLLIPFVLKNFDNLLWLHYIKLLYIFWDCNHFIVLATQY